MVGAYYHIASAIHSKARVNAKVNAYSRHSLVSVRLPWSERNECNAEIARYAWFHVRPVYL